MGRGGKSRALGDLCLIETERCCGWEVEVCLVEKGRLARWLKDRARSVKALAGGLVA